MHTRLLIIGAGPAGYTAGIYAGRAALEPILITGSQPGGQLTITTEVENYPGFSEVIQGPWLMEQMRLQTERSLVNLITDSVLSLDLQTHPFQAKTEGGLTVTAEAVIMATGAQARWLGLESEEKFRGFGVSACATCDGFFFKNQTVAVVGGGNTAVEEALFLTHFAKEVILIHRRDSLRAEKVLQDRLMKHPKIRILWDHAVEEITGDLHPKKVTGLRLRHTKNQQVQNLSVDGVFIAIGHVPMSTLVRAQVACDKDGYILTKAGSTQTSVPGFFAAGDVQDKIFRQAVTAAGQGCMAAIEAGAFLDHIKDQKEDA
jgi:thioredoxin reductase (NADPH)